MKDFHQLTAVTSLHSSTLIEECTAAEEQHSTPMNKEAASLFHKYNSMGKTMSDFIDKLVELFETTYNSSLPPLQITDNGKQINFNGIVLDHQILKELMEQFVQQDNIEKIIELYCLFDDRQCYTRNLVFENRFFTLIVLCWNPNQSRFAFITKLLY